jgi:hypothetical protein
MKSIIVSGNMLLSLAILSSCSAGEPDTEVSDGAGVAKVVATQIDFDDEECAQQGLPVALHLKNNGNMPTSLVFWEFRVNEKNHSTNLAEHTDYAKTLTDPNRRTDRIIQPRETFKVCSSPPDLLGKAHSEQLEYRVEVDARF